MLALAQAFRFQRAAKKQTFKRTFPSSLVPVMIFIVYKKMKAGVVQHGSPRRTSYILFESMAAVAPVEPLGFTWTESVLPEKNVLG